MGINIMVGDIYSILDDIIILTYGQIFGVDLVNNPDLAAKPEMAAKLAIAFWKYEIPQHLRENVRESAKILNGGINGMSERVLRSQQWEKVITTELIKKHST